MSNMIKKLLLTLSAAGACSIAAKAQPIVNPCATDDVYHRLVKDNPEILIKEEQLRQQIAERLQTLDFSKLAKTTEGVDETTVYHVPLVFHVIHEYGAENVSDAAIQACVAKINSMYGKYNADTVDVIGTYRGIVPNTNKRYIGNARIVWHLATKDPMGNPTNGITRRRHYLAFSGNDFAKFDQWPSSNYMNIWLISRMSASNANAAAYAYKPATGDVIPYYDGVIGLYTYVNESDYTFSHELGHELNLDHPWGGTNNPEVACGDDEVDDTPPTKGHSPSARCSPAALYDTVCLYSRNIAIGKLRIDSTRRADSPAYSLALMKDTSTSRGLIFKCRTATSIDSFSFYPAAAIGSTYIVGLYKNGVLADTQRIVTTVIDSAQRVKSKFKLGVADTLTTYRLLFVQNPGAWKDSSSAALRAFPKGLNGTVWLRGDSSFQTNNYYNFFYNLKITYGFFKIYDKDSLVDYPDTVNAQNVMDYTYCSKMFTYGQVMRMRAALTSSIAHRDSLITEYNTKIRTGLFDAPALAPKADMSVERSVNTGGISIGTDRSYFMCKDDAANPFFFKFQNRSWQATPTSVDWTLSNAATVGATTSSTGAVTTKFGETGWATVTATATNANGSSSVSERVYVADPTSINPIGYYQEFNNLEENKRWPIFNYYNNRYAWEYVNYGGYYDQYSFRYRSFDNRTALKDVINGDPAGDYDDFFTPAFDLSVLPAVNGNLNFMYAGAYATNNRDYMKDTLEIAYSDNCGASWKTFYKMGGTQMQTVGSVPPAAGEYVPSYEDWRPRSIDLKDGATTIRGSRVFFRFRYKPSSRPFAFVMTNGMYASGNNFYVDRINISNNPLAVNEMSMGDKLATVSPNPTQSNAYVLFSKANAQVNIRVMDITGKTVYTASDKIDATNGRIEIPASALGAKGMYMVQITGENGLNQTEKLVVY